MKKILAFLLAVSQIMCISASAFAEDVIPTDGAPAITDTIIADDAEAEEEDIIDEDVAEDEENIEDEEITEEDEIVENDEIVDDDEDVNDEDVFETDDEETAKDNNNVAEEDGITEDEPVIKSERVNVTPYASNTTASDTIRVEFENIVKNTGTVNAYASTDVGVSGKYVYWNGGKEVSFTATVDVVAAGAYELMIFGTYGSKDGANPKNIYMSELRYSVNNGTTLCLPDTMSKREDVTYTASGWPLGDKDWKMYKMYTSVNLVKGSNTITFTLPERVGGSTGTYGVLDYFELTKDVDVTSLTLTADSATKRGGKVNYTLKNQNGVEVTAKNLDTLAVTVENEKIAGAAKNEVTARNYGSTNLKVYAKTKNGDEFNLTAPIEVVSETGLSIENVSKTETGVSVTLKAAEAYASGAKLLIVVQGKKDDQVTSVTKVVTEDVPEIAKDTSATLTPTVDGVDTNSTISVYLVKADNADCAVYKKFAL